MLATSRIVKAVCRGHGPAWRRGDDKREGAAPERTVQAYLGWIVMTAPMLLAQSQRRSRALSFSGKKQKKRGKCGCEKGKEQIV